MPEIQQRTTVSPITVTNELAAPGDANRHRASPTLDLVGIAAEWFEQYPVTHFFTLTYGSTVSLGRRMTHFHDWVDGIEWLQRRPLGWIRADEMKHFSGCGMPAIPEHHHGLLIGAHHLDYRTAEALWHSCAGDAQVERYEPGGGAIAYSLKLAFHPIGDWDLGGLKRFSPHSTVTSRIS
jgi:hypothetical protein